MKASEILNIISKQWCDLNDLMQLTQVGKTRQLK